MSAREPNNRSDAQRMTTPIIESRVPIIGCSLRLGHQSSATEVRGESRTVSTTRKLAALGVIRDASGMRAANSTL